MTVQDNAPSIPPVDLWLSRFAKVVVAVAFWLIFVGGHTTTTGAGMAFPDWPLSHGSLNPDGWWENLMMRLEHGHRLTAGLIGVMVGALCAWIWKSKWSVPVSLAGAVVIGAVARTVGTPVPFVGLIGIVASTLIFSVMLVRDHRSAGQPWPGAVRWLAFAAFIGVVAQAILGGLRVVLDPQGIAATDQVVATTFRVLHGCFAQIELALLVALAARVSPKWQTLPDVDARPSFLAWTVVGALGLQLLIGAIMRHMGAGLAISTFPGASPSGSWLPVVHNAYVDSNFTHTRVGAMVVTVLNTILSLRTLRQNSGQSLVTKPALGLLALTAAQIALGISIIWYSRPAIVTTLHVVNGAAILATAVLLAVRLGRASKVSTPLPQNPNPTLLRATV